MRELIDEGQQLSKDPFLIEHLIQYHVTWILSHLMLPFITRQLLVVA